MIITLRFRFDEDLTRDYWASSTIPEATLFGEEVDWNFEHEKMVHKIHEVIKQETNFNHLPAYLQIYDITLNIDKHGSLMAHVQIVCAQVPDNVWKNAEETLRNYQTETNNEAIFAWIAEKHFVGSAEKLNRMEYMGFEIKQRVA